MFPGKTIKNPNIDQLVKIVNEATRIKGKPKGTGARSKEMAVVNLYRQRWPQKAHNKEQFHVAYSMSQHNGLINCLVCIRRKPVKKIIS